MNSLLALIFLSIQKQIADNTPVKHINEDTGQLADERPGISYPCALISMGNTAFTSLAENCQVGTIPVTVRLIFEAHSSSANNTPDKYKKLALGVYEVEHSVHQALQGWAPAWIVDDVDILADVTGSLNRLSSGDDNRRADLRIRQVVYKLGIDDYGTANWQEYVPAPPMVFTGEIIEGLEIDL